LQAAGRAILAGACAALFAAPGPAAAWGLARTQMSAPTLRGTMAVYFVVAYAAILVAFAFSGLLAPTDWRALGFLALVCIAGALAGIAFGDRMSGTLLHRAIALIIMVSGLSLLLPFLLRSWGAARPAAQERRSAAHGSGVAGAHVIAPGHERIQHLAQNLRIIAAAALRHVKGMIGVLEEFQGRAAAERGGERLQLVQRRQRVARALQEQHRDLYIEQVAAALA